MTTPPRRLATAGRDRHDPRLAALRRICFSEALDALDLDHEPWRTLLRPLLAPAATRLAAALLEIDAHTARAGFRAAAAAGVARFAGGVVAHGVATLPPDGPLLVTSNHPGLTDPLALAATLPRDDLAVVALPKPMLTALPHVGRRLLLLEAGRERRTLRAAADHLRRGGAVLLYPAGRIEPDPALGAAEAAAARAGLAAWSPSPALLAQLVPGLVTVPAIVSGVVHPGSRRHGLTRLRRDPQARAWLAATLQSLLPRYQNRPVSVHYGPPLHGATDPAALRSAADDLLAILPDPPSPPPPRGAGPGGHAVR